MPKDPTKYKKWPIMDGVVKYVKEVIGSHWPEFEEKLNSSPFNAVYYYAKTGLSPKDSKSEPVIREFPINVGSVILKPEVPIGKV